MTQLSFEANLALNQQEFNEGKLILKSRPTYAWVAFTGRCNLNCAHCARRLRSFRALPETEDLTRPLFDKIKAQVLPWLKRFQLGGNNLGEQLYAPTWDEYYGEMRSYPGRPVLQTSGMLLNNERIESLVASGAQVNLSLEGATPGTYHDVRGRSLDELIEFARYFNQERQRQNSKAEIKLTYTSFYDNIREVPQLVEICKEVGVDMLVLTHLLPLHEGQRYQSLVYHQSLANEMYDEAERIARELGVKIATPQRFKVKPLHKSPEPKEIGLINPQTIPVGREKAKSDSNGNGMNGNNQSVALHQNGQSSKQKTQSPKIIGPGRSTSKSMPICVHPWTSVSITEDGDVHPCCASGMIMGNLNESSLDEIWNNKRYQTMRATVNSAQPAFADCQFCVLRGIDLENDTGGELLCSEPKVLLAHLDARTTDLGQVMVKRVQKAMLANQWGKRIYPLARRLHHRIFQ